MASIEIVKIGHIHRYMHGNINSLGLICQRTHIKRVLGDNHFSCYEMAFSLYIITS